MQQHCLFSFRSTVGQLLPSIPETREINRTTSKGRVRSMQPCSRGSREDFPDFIVLFTDFLVEESDLVGLSGVLPVT